MTQANGRHSVDNGAGIAWGASALPSRLSTIRIQSHLHPEHATSPLLSSSESKDPFQQIIRQAVQRGGRHGGAGRGSSSAPAAPSCSCCACPRGCPPQPVRASVSGHGKAVGWPGGLGGPPRESKSAGPSSCAPVAAQPFTRSPADRIKDGDQDKTCTRLHQPPKRQAFHPGDSLPSSPTHCQG